MAPWCRAGAALVHRLGVAGSPRSRSCILDGGGASLDIRDIQRSYERFKYGEACYPLLTRHRIRRILLVATFYDSYILEQEGHLAELVLGDFHQLHLTNAPSITSVPTGAQALEELGAASYDLVVTMMRIGEMTPFELARRSKERYPDLPVMLLANVPSDLAGVDPASEKMRPVDDVFLWRGDSKLLMAMLKYVEDRVNAPDDTAVGHVRVILLVEDGVSAYSWILPMLYAEVMRQTWRIIDEEVLETSRSLRMRLRPKVLMAHTYEAAWEQYQTYRDSLMCVISDVSYPRGGKVEREAGLALLDALRRLHPSLPLCLQSSEDVFDQRATELEATFLHKSSPHFGHELRRFFERDLGFGDFVFRDEGDCEVARAHTMLEFERLLRTVPSSSLAWHGTRNQFSRWLIAHGELSAARELRPVRVEDHGGPDQHRDFLVKFFERIRRERSRGKVVAFDEGRLTDHGAVVRLGTGALGGKGRGLAFLSALLAAVDFERKFPGVAVRIPRTWVVGTDEYDRFVEGNDLDRLKLEGDDEVIKRSFLGGAFSPALERNLRSLAEVARAPLAVRSSSLLEDSQSQPFAGIYSTYMLPNNEPLAAERYRHLADAVKLVFASGFLRQARDYFETIEYEREEEKMGVVLQEVVGGARGGYFYPHVSGVAASYDYYPMPFMKHADGIARLAVGLGRYVVDGHEGYRFCPVYPTLHTRPADEIPATDQVEFYAIDLNKEGFDLARGEEETLSLLGIREAEKHDVLWSLASTFDAHAQRIVEGISAPGPRVIDFAGILKSGSFPLAEILRELLPLGERALGAPVEIEFALALDEDRRAGVVPSFNLLQIRPLLTRADDVVVDPSAVPRERTVLFAEQAMGHGEYDHLRDVVYVPPEAFDHTRTEGIRDAVARLNAELKRQGRDYLLIGPGRWGTRDRFLGIPVEWGDISRARMIVEAGLEGFQVEASQGTHFFHNLVALNVAYVTVPFSGTSGFVNYAWLGRQERVATDGAVVHVRTADALVVKVGGVAGRALVHV